MGKNNSPSSRGVPEGLQPPGLRRRGLKKFLRGVLDHGEYSKTMSRRGKWGLQCCRSAFRGSALGLDWFEGHRVTQEPGNDLAIGWNSGNIKTSTVGTSVKREQPCGLRKTLSEKTHAIPKGSRPKETTGCQVNPKGHSPFFASSSQEASSIGVTLGGDHRKSISPSGYQRYDQRH